MNGYGSHTYSFINADNKRFWVKFHFKTQQGIQCMSQEEADRIAGEDPDYHTRQLFETIERGEYPKWTFHVQIMPEEEAEIYRWNPFDHTRVWPHADYPLIEVGVLEMNRNPENYFAEVEQAAFSPANVVPGISFSPCKMLQARIFAYADAHRYRLGVNYEPNSFGSPTEDPSYNEPPLTISGDADRYEQQRGVDDDYFQPGNLYRLMSPEQQKELIQNIVGSLKKVPKEIQQKMIAHFRKADKAYGDGVARRLGLP